MEEIKTYLMLSLSKEWDDCSDFNSDAWMNNVLLRATAIAMEQPIVLMMADSNPGRFFLYAHTRRHSTLNSVFNDHLGHGEAYSISEVTDVRMAMHLSPMGMNIRQ